MEPSAVFYSHQRRDGLYDSICLECFEVAATAETEDELGDKRREHHCDDATKVDDLKRSLRRFE